MHSFKYEIRMYECSKALKKYAAICFWKFGAQSPTTPLLPPREGSTRRLLIYNGPRYNPLLRPAAARTPSNTIAHQPASCVCLTHFFNDSVRKATHTSLTSQCERQYNDLCL
ncbi:hypothetical protein F511_43398 [Dorcoceras hygrometricum]|uniref:Uncharacterized protein n=1 Tax=Dorcoceras hygrometricum TaxID=472368 RepID=A0A2Z7ATC1_9LAMI|nr:hypothetical protein F511_43398 [Dorcoceras hygrometricum]